MPLIVTTTTTDPELTSVTSSDGTLTATADQANGGVLLRSNFANDWGVSDNFEANITNWSAPAGGSVARTTTSPITGSGSLKWTRTATLSVITRSLPVLAAQPYERKVVVRFDATATAKVTLAASIGNVVSALGDVDTTTRYGVMGTIYLPANVPISGNLAIGATSATASGDVTVDNLTVVVQPPLSVYFYRDGIPVRGASPSLASGGVAYAYDYESTFGKAAIWTAQPVYAIRDTEVTAPIGPGVSLLVPDLPADLNMSLKSLSQPDLSRRVIGKWPAATRSWTSRNNLSANPGASLSSGTWDTPVSATQTWVMETTTHDEGEAFQRLLLSGPLLVQHAIEHHTADMYAVVDSISCDFKRGPLSPELLWTVGFLPIEQPTAVGAPLLIPGHSYQYVQDAYGTYANLASGAATYDDLVTPAA